jgi:hypothetical protein
MWRITYKSFSLQQVLMMASMNVMDAKPSAEAFGPGGHQVRYDELAAWRVVPVFRKDS